MKKLLCLLLAVVMLAGLGVGAGAMNTTPGKITDEEICVFFNENRELLQDIATKLLAWAEENEGSIIIYRNDSKVTDAQLLRQLEQYFDLVGTNNGPSIFASYHFSYVSFSFMPHRELEISIEYAPSNTNNRGYYRLDDDWSITALCISWADPPLLWWQKLPSFLQFLLRWFCFGWLWMK